MKSQPSRPALRSQAEPIAVVGIGCRLPGNVSSTSQLWHVLCNAESGHSQVPAERYNADAYSHQASDGPGIISSTAGYFVQEDLRLFDNAFFGINNVEAMSMDPQQRKLLEVVYEAFENAGFRLPDLSGANVGCYVANFTQDHLISQLQDLEHVGRYTATGAAPSVLANRISSVFNLRGPSVVMDTACSSSLYGLHAACTALDNDECSAAVVASANLIQSHAYQTVASKAGILSTSGLCRTFDEAADGYGRADGVGALVLKRLSHAIRDGDPIRAVIRGTATNSNGRTNGIMQPSSDAQEDVIRKAYARAGLNVDQTDYVEAHGTGTAVGDPIEVEAISRVFKHRSGRPILIGSVKTNLGHSEANSGLTSIIKAILALENLSIPPTVGLKTLNPKLNGSSSNVQVVVENTPWPSTSCQRASINSFGFGGANAHAIIESASAHLVAAKMPAFPSSSTLTRLHVVPISAHSNESLKSQSRVLGQYLTSKAKFLPASVYTRVRRRTEHPRRGYLLIDGQSVLKSVPQDLAQPAARSSATHPLVFVFTGQGASWLGMGQELYDQYPVFKQAITALDSHLESFMPGPSFKLEDLFVATESSIDITEPRVAQVYCTALQIALIDLLSDWSIQPKTVVGHSSGEIAAAYAAGYISKHEAAALAFHRGQAVGLRDKNLPPGGMLAAGISKTKAAEQIKNLSLDQQLVIACLNSPTSVTISGDSDAIGLLQKHFEGDSIFCRRLPTHGTAYHSHHMQGAVADAYFQSIKDLFAIVQKPSASRSVEMMSTVSASPVPQPVARTPEYWVSNLTSPVKFEQGLGSLLQDKDYEVIEVGPHAALRMAVKDIRSSIDSDSAVSDDLYVATLIRSSSSERSMLNLAGGLFQKGHNPDLYKANRLCPEDEHIDVNMPPYSWDYGGKLLWREPRISQEQRTRKYKRHELLGTQCLAGSGMTYTWRNLLSLAQAPWIGHHRFGQTVLFPAAGFISMVLEAMRQINESTITDCPSMTLRDIRFFKVLPVAEDGATTELFTEVRKLPISIVSTSKLWWRFEISSFFEGQATSHMAGLVAFQHHHPSGLPSALSSLSKDAMQPQAPRMWMKRFDSLGLNLGPSFKSLQGIHAHPNGLRLESVVTVPMSRGGCDEQTGQHEYFAHPVVIDAMLQSACIAASAGKAKNLRPWIPLSIAEFHVQSAGNIAAEPGEMWEAAAIAKHTGFDTINASVELRAMERQALFQIQDLQSTIYQGVRNVNDFSERIPCLELCWKPDISFLAAYTALPKTHLLRSGHPAAEIDSLLHYLIDLATHKYRGSTILSVGTASEDATGRVYTLDAETPYRRFHSWHMGTIDPDTGHLTGSHMNDGSRHVDVDQLQLDPNIYDLVISAQILDYNVLRTLLDLINPNSHALVFLEENQLSYASRNHWSRTIIDTHVPHLKIGLFTPLKTAPVLSGDIYMIVDKDSDHLKLNDLLEQTLTNKHRSKVTQIPFPQVNEQSIPEGAHVIATIEHQKNILADLRKEEMERIQYLTNRASRMLWLTKSGLSTAENPDASLFTGLARGVMLEQPSLKIACFDVDSASEPDVTCNNISMAFQRLISPEPGDLEYAQRNNVVHVSRMVPRKLMNQTFHSKISEAASLCSLRDAPCALSLTIEHAGQLETLRFQSKALPVTLVDDQVEVEVKSYSMNAKDLYLLSARFAGKDRSCSSEFAGVIKRIGPSVENLIVGDRVVVGAPGNYDTLAIVPAWACEKMLPNEKFETMCTFPAIFGASIYALKYKADLQPGESVLIHSATGGFGLAAIQIAYLMGATVYATAGTAEKRQYLVDNCGIPANHVFSSRDSSFLPAIMEVTNGEGVDVILNSLTGDLLHDSFKACASFGRFIELGKKDIIEVGQLEMSQFGRNVSFMAFDLTDLYRSPLKKHHETWRLILRENLDLYRSGKIKAVAPCKVFDVSELTQAFRYFAQPTRLGKVVVSLQNPDAKIMVLPSKYDSQFSPHKSYLMIGGFGGLGRSVTRWMQSQGARSFIFLSRSGVKSEPAAKLVAHLRNAGAEAHIVTGDVGIEADVKRALSASPLPIGGVIQASMLVSGGHWASLPLEEWHRGIQAKHTGTWNVHRALQEHEQNLDFFLLVGSLSGSVGGPTEPGYCAANAFLDNFARYRRRQGLKATSLALGALTEVGYLHEHPEMEASFMRRGLRGIPEDEMLQLVDLALSQVSAIDEKAGRENEFSDAQILTGLELDEAIKQAREQGTSAIEVILQDPRAGYLYSHYKREVGAVSEDRLSHAMLADSQKSGLAESAIIDIIAKKFASIIMMPLEQLAHDAPLTSFGLDSMLAAELRNYVFQRLEVDLPFTVLLSGQASIAHLAQLVLAATSASSAPLSTDKAAFEMEASVVA